MISLVRQKQKGINAMHVKGFLHKLLNNTIHKSRIKVLSEVVLSALKIKQLKLTSLGRSINLPIQERSGIQKVNRLLKNKNLHSDRFEIQRLVSQLLISNHKRPHIVVDWSKYPNSDDAILRAALCAEGRSLTLYEERGAFKKMGHPGFQRRFLANLKRVLPQGVRPILITDAGFHNIWFKDILNLGWDYIGRIRHRKSYKSEGMIGFKPCRNLFSKASKKPMALGKVELTKNDPLTCYFYLVKSDLKGRKALRRDGTIKQDKDSKNYSRSYREPWLLVSSLGGRNAAKKIVNLYKLRMTIEESFRDLKSSQYGLSLDKNCTRKAHRRDILLLIGMLANLIAWLTGKAGERKNIQYQFQSNSIKNRRVLSFFYLGCQMIRKKIRITLKEIMEILTLFNQEINYM